MKSKHIWGPVVFEFAWNLYGNAATLGQNCQFSRLQQTNLLAYMFCLGIKNHHFSATSWCMSNRVSFQNQATDTCCQESRHESLILIGSQNLYFDAFGSLYLSFPKKLRYTIVIYGKIQSYRNCKIQGWSCTQTFDELVALVIKVAMKFWVRCTTKWVAHVQRGENQGGEMPIVAECDTKTYREKLLRMLYRWPFPTKLGSV